MDSSINTAKPYKEKGPPRRKAPVRNPRPKKEIMPMIKSLISPVERQAIRAGQAKLIAETEKASATTIQQAIRSNLARKAVKTARSSTISYEKVINTLSEYVPDYIKDKETSYNEFKSVVKSLVDYANKNPNPNTPGFAEGTGFVKIKGKSYGQMNAEMKKLNDIPMDKSPDNINYIKNVVKDINDLVLEIHRDNRRSRDLKPSPKNEIVAKKPKNEIVPKVSAPPTATPKPKKERKARATKPAYKMSYATALKGWNASRGEAMYCNPRKGSPEYNEVQALRL